LIATIIATIFEDSISIVFSRVKFAGALMISTVILIVVC